MKTESYTLKHPIEWNGTKVDKIEFRRPKGKDLRAMGALKSSDAERGLWMMMTLSEMPSEFFDELEAADYVGFSTEIQGFFGIPST